MACRQFWVAIAMTIACGRSRSGHSTADAVPRQQPVTAVLRVADVDTALVVYGNVLAAVPRLVLYDRDGRIHHAELAIGASVIWVDRSEREHPLALGGTSGYLEVPGRAPVDVAGWVAHGELWRDPFGHVWRFGTTLSPVLAIEHNGDAGFYARAFGVEVVADRLRYRGDDIGLVRDAHPWLATPRALGGAPLRVHLYVPRCEVAFARARDAGALARATPTLEFWGDLWAMVEDGSGHTWGLGERVEMLTQAAMQARLER